MYHANVNVNLMVENLIQFKSRKNVNATVKIQKNIMHAKKNIFGILLLHVVVKMANIYQVLLTIQ